MADRALVDTRCLQLVLRASLVAPGARLTSLWDCHNRPRSVAEAPFAKALPGRSPSLGEAVRHPGRVNPALPLERSETHDEGSSDHLRDSPARRRCSGEHGHGRPFVERFPDRLDPRRLFHQLRSRPRPAPTRRPRWARPPARTSAGRATKPSTPTIRAAPVLPVHGAATTTGAAQTAGPAAATTTAATTTQAPATPTIATTIAAVDDNSGRGSGDHDDD